MSEMSEQQKKYVAFWISTLSPGDAAFVHGAAFQCMAIAAGISEADLYVVFAQRVAADPDCQVVR